MAGTTNANTNSNADNGINFNDNLISELYEPNKLNANVNFNIPLNIQHEKKEFKCTCCGASFDKQKNNFSKSQSSLYAANNGYINICNSCREIYFNKMIDFYSGNQSKAIKHLCQQFDILFNEKALKAFKTSNNPDVRFSTYLQKKNLGQSAVAGSTFTDGMLYDYMKASREAILNKDQAKEYNITAVTIDRWGDGLTDLEYKNLETHYKMLKKNNPNADSNQEIFIKNLCELHMLKLKEIRQGNIDKVVKLDEQYMKQFKQAGLKTFEEKDSSNNDTLGVTLAVISKFTPEEFYKNKELYKDYSGLGEYFDRHVRRPLQNLQFNEDVRDFEYFVPESEEDIDD